MRMVKCVLPHCVNAVTHIINDSLRNGIVFIVTPLPKGNKIDRLNDLRPISVLPIFSKVLEKVIYS